MPQWRIVEGKPGMGEANPGCEKPSNLLPSEQPCWAVFPVFCLNLLANLYSSAVKRGTGAHRNHTAKSPSVSVPVAALSLRVLRRHKGGRRQFLRPSAEPLPPSPSLCTILEGPRVAAPIYKG